MKKRGMKIFISLILYILALVLPFSNKIVNNVIFLASYIIVGFEIIKKAVRNIFRGKVFDENFLMTVATVGAIATGEFPEAVAVMLFYQVGELFQSYAVDKSRKSIASLMDIRPDYANVKRNEKIEKVDPDEVQIGELIIVKPGEKIPLDGIVVEGKSYVDTKALTGESVPREVKENEEVLSGCINQNGVLTIKVTKEYEDSTVSKILDLVENASNKKSKSENFITKFAKYYTPIVVILAVILAIVPPIILHDASFKEWIYRALSFLVVSCPCALVISIPLGFFGGIGGASKTGILIKGSNYLEALAKTETVVFDKTGTLTQGVFEVQEINEHEILKEELLKYTAYAENFSNHPIALSVKNAYGKDIDEKLISNAEELTGLGVISIVEDKKVCVGNEKMMKEQGIEYEINTKIGTILYIAVDGKFKGSILISDKIKKDSKKTISELKKHGVKNTVMLTGDKKEIGEYIGKELEIDSIYTELLPDQKANMVEKLLDKKSEKGKVVFVGDGINDAPVLTLADIGIAMGGLGADSAIEAADIVIMNDEPSKILKAMEISKKTMKIVKENIIFAIVIKIAVLILCALGLSSMWEAVFADVGVSIIAILNSLRMLHIKED